MAILGVNLTTSGVNVNPEMEGTPVRDFLLGVKWVTSLLVLTFETGRHISLILTLRWEDTLDLSHTFCWKPM